MFFNYVFINIRLKMKFYEELENSLTAEREKVEACRKQILQDRLNAQSQPASA